MAKKSVLVFLIFVLALFVASPAFAADASFVIEAADTLEKNYVDKLDRCALFNSAIEGLEEALKEAKLSDTLESIPEDKCPDAQNYFIAEFAQAAEAARDKIGETELAFKATDHMAESLNDSHVRFLAPERYREREEMLTGKISYAGIGTTLHKADDDIYVVEVYDGAPAGNLLKPFDRIASVNGQEIKTDADVNEVVDLIRGEEGTGLTITVSRFGIPEPLGFTLRRALVKPPVVSSKMLADNVGYLKIYTFWRQDISSEVSSKIKNLSDEGMKAIVLDLRGNSGGILGELMIVAGTFFPKKTALCRMRDNKKEEAVLAESSFFQPYLSKEDVPVVLLIDDGSASASEILAAAMQEYGRATLVGEKTAAAVDVAKLIDLPEGAGMNVTISRIITPNGAALGKVGVTPDVVVPFESKDYALGRDPQLLRAVEIIKSKMK